MMLSDPWLNRWLPLLRERAGSGLVFEIGCGHGDDTATLTSAGLKVHGLDLSPVAVAIAKLRVPSAVLECRDILDPFPEQARDLGTVIASLSLHYFSWSETRRIIQRIRSTLGPAGVLLSFAAACVLGLPVVLVTFGAALVAAPVLVAFALLVAASARFGSRYGRGKHAT